MSGGEAGRTITDNDPAVILAAVLRHVVRAVVAGGRCAVHRGCCRRRWRGCLGGRRQRNRGRLRSLQHADAVQLAVRLDDVRVVDHRELLRRIFPRVQRQRLRAAEVPVALVRSSDEEAGSLQRAGLNGPNG